MNKQSIATSLLVLLTVTAGSILQAATPGVPETWGSGSVAGWTRQDPLNAITLTATNPADYLQVVFGTQSQPFPEVNIIRADVSASGGAFSGDYWVTAVTNVSFKLYCPTQLPGALHLCFCSNVSSNWWYYPLSAPVVGDWTLYNVPLEYGTGWWTGSGAGAAQFVQDRKSVGWVGVRVQRGSDLQSQAYGLDDFVLLGASQLKDADADGANDWQEFMAGTGVNDPNSRFALRTGSVKTNHTRAVGVVLHWNSALGRNYTVQRSTDLTQGFSTIGSGVPGNPPENECEDTTATNTGAYFYKVNVE